MTDTILITGGNGNLGRLVAERLEAQGTQVVSFDLPGSEGPHSEARHAVILGDIRDAESVVRIAGEVTGDVVGSEKVLISKSGRVHGNVAAPRVQLEDGALFRGSIDMNPTQASAEPKPVAAAKPSPAA